jgi:hypothetical protein
VRKSGVDDRRNHSVTRFSRLVRPGTTKAQIWYSHTGVAMSMPTNRLTVIWMARPSVGPEKLTRVNESGRLAWKSTIGCCSAEMIGS